MNKSELLKEIYSIFQFKDIGHWNGDEFTISKKQMDTLDMCCNQAVSKSIGWISNCVECSRIVDTREIKEGGDGFGLEVEDGTWVCSMDCYDANVGINN